MMSNTLLESVVEEKPRPLNPLYAGAVRAGVLDRSNIGFAKETYQLDTGLNNEAYALRPVSSLWSMPSSGCRPIYRCAD